jgi:D-serine deaminase-like pyridoxal phosphate-dependent protein
MSLRIGDLDTPAVLIDLDIMEANLARMAAFCRKHRLALRPHTKTHKVPELAHRQIRSGACGITVAKVGEAEVMAAAGLDNILIAYPVIGAQKVERLARLARRVSMTVALDSREAAEWISSGLTVSGASVGVLVEINTGFGRCGVTIGPDAVDLARYVQSLPGLNFRGVMVYPGNFLTDPDKHAALVAAERARDQEIVDLFQKAGLPLTIFSAGSTPSAPLTGDLPAVNEIRPGTYIYNDMNTVGSGACTLADCAATAMVTVVSTAVPGKAMMDGGSKTFSSDALRTGKAKGYGYIVEDPNASVSGFNEEHGHLDLSDSQKTYRVGERLRVIPNHVCAMINLHDQVYGVRGETVEVVWTVAGRGKLQ